MFNVLPYLGYPNFSGVNDFDYQPLVSMDGVTGGDKQVTSTKRVPLPEELVEQFARIFSFVVNCYYNV